MEPDVLSLIPTKGLYWIFTSTRIGLEGMLTDENPQNYTYQLNYTKEKTQV